MTSCSPEPPVNERNGDFSTVAPSLGTFLHKSETKIIRGLTLMFWRQVLRFGSRLGLMVLATAFLLVVSLRAYVHYEVHRATALQAEACRVQIGDAEATVFPLIDRYSGFKWTPDSLGPRENWIDKEEYDYQKSLESDYRYYLAVSPYELLANDVRSGQTRADRTVRAVMNNTSVQLRSVLGMRDWNAGVEVAIRDGRVQSVLGMVLVEGRSGWMGNIWKLANAMPNRELQGRAYVVRSAHLNMATNSGSMIENYFTPRASNEEMQASRKFNTACLTSLRGCDGFCEFVPHTLEYLKQHPDAAGNFSPSNCP